MCDLEVHTVNVTTDDESRTRSALCFVGLKRASDRLIRVATIWSNQLSAGSRPCGLRGRVHR